MNLQQLLASIESLHPELDAVGKARLLLLVTVAEPRLSNLENEDQLLRHLHDIQLRIQSATDQHSAVADELDQLASSDPCEFSPSHVWTLIRAIKVQSRILDMYLDPVQV